MTICAGTPYPFSVNPPYSDVLWNDASRARTPPPCRASVCRSTSATAAAARSRRRPPTSRTSSSGGCRARPRHFTDALAAAGVPYHYVNYGDGTGTPWADCGGSHSRKCWNHDFTDYIPRLQQAFGI
ncbi:hypothetical protein ACU686_00090 [Yinghuangia aomiensis]